MCINNHCGKNATCKSKKCDLDLSGIRITDSINKLYPDQQIDLLIETFKALTVVQRGTAIFHHSSMVKKKNRKQNILYKTGKNCIHLAKVTKT